MRIRDLFDRYQGMTSFAPLGFELQRAKGIYLYDSDGRPFIDLIAGISVCSLGHGDPDVLTAIRTQAEQYCHVMVYGEMVLSPQAEFARDIIAALPDGLDKVYFTNSGAEAAEGAIKLARRYTGRAGITAQMQAYHGSTAGALSLMSDPYYTNRYRPLVPGVRFIRQNHTADFRFIDQNTAAAVLELVQAERGAKVADPGFIKELAVHCKSVGALLILDEIQTGMGRCGSLYLFEQYGIVPDILLTGKAFGAGMPLAAFIAKADVMDALADNPVLGHITTFGGHPVSCAAAAAGWKKMQQLQLHQRAGQLETVFRRQLSAVANAEIQGKGALLALHLGSDERCRITIRHCLELGLISDWFLFAPNALRIAPPLVMTDEQAVQACQIILEAVSRADRDLQSLQ
jgi:acetylornithine/succinyldiaminopimelate/putrescine aminotransferase